MAGRARECPSGSQRPEAAPAGNVQHLETADERAACRLSVLVPAGCRCGRADLAAPGRHQRAGRDPGGGSAGAAGLAQDGRAMAARGGAAAGPFQGVRGPGLFFLVPFIETIQTLVDMRIRTTEIRAEQALTRDTVSIGSGCDRVLAGGWMPAQAAIDIADYRQAMERVAQTSLREMIGTNDLSRLLSDRQAADQELQRAIGAKTAIGASPSPRSRSRTWHSGGAAGCDEPAGAGRARKAGAGDAGLGRGRHRAAGEAGGGDLCVQIRRRSSCGR